MGARLQRHRRKGAEGRRQGGKLPANMEGLPWESMLYVKDAAVTKLPAP
ncbi:MAG: hypothetical protein R3F14_16860 [Polyangiaceae bacterium]